MSKVSAKLCILCGFGQQKDKCVRCGNQTGDIKV